MVADEAALAVLRRAGVGVLSEESGFEPGHDRRDRGDRPDRRLHERQSRHPVVRDVAVPRRRTTDPPSRWSSTRRTACATRPNAAGERGAASAACVRPAARICGGDRRVSAVPPPDVGWAQFRAFGACALDLCRVADGVVDGFVDFGRDEHGVWDYLGGLLICREAGIDVVDAFDREMVHADHAARRTPVAAGDPGVGGRLARRPPTKCVGSPRTVCIRSYALS